MWKLTWTKKGEGNNARWTERVRFNNEGQGGSKAMNTYNLEETLQAFYQLRLTGNIVPHVWYKKITLESGRADLLGCSILAEIVYWYRPQEIRDEQTGALITLKKKFKADMLQRSINSFAEQFGKSRRQVSDALSRLEKQGLIIKECRNLTVGTLAMGNVLFLAPVFDNIAELQADPSIDLEETPDWQEASGDDYFTPWETSPPLCKKTHKLMQKDPPYVTEGTPLCENLHKGMQKNAQAYVNKRCTYTENTTEISKKQTTTENPTLSDHSKTGEQPEPVVRSVGFLNESLEKHNPAQTSQPITPAVQVEEPTPNQSVIIDSTAEGSQQPHCPPPTARIEDSRIAETLTSVQKSHVKQAVDMLAARRIISVPQQICAEIEFALLDPHTMNRIHFSFSRKFAAILRLVKEKRWATPSGMRDITRQADSNSARQEHPHAAIDPNEAAINEIDVHIKNLRDEINFEHHMLNLISTRDDPFFIGDRAKREANIKRCNAEIDSLCKKRKRLLADARHSGVDPPQAMVG